MKRIIIHTITPSGQVEKAVEIRNNANAVTFEHDGDDIRVTIEVDTTRKANAVLNAITATAQASVANIGQLEAATAEAEAENAAEQQQAEDA